MAEDELEEVSSLDDSAEETIGRRKVTRVNLSDSTLKILKTFFHYLLVVIIALGVSFIVSNRISTKSQGELVEQEMEQFDVFVRRKPGIDWAMDEMIVNTADEEVPHIVKAKVVVSYDIEKKAISDELNLRNTEIHSEVRSIIGSKKYTDINTTEKQKILAREIKTRIQLIVGRSGIIDVFLKEFTVH